MKGEKMKEKKKINYKNSNKELNLKYSPMLEGNACIIRAKRKVVPFA